MGPITRGLTTPRARGEGTRCRKKMIYKAQEIRRITPFFYLVSGESIVGGLRELEGQVSGRG